MTDDSKRRAAPRSAWSESTREKQNEWKRENRMKCAADVDRQTGLLFRDYCAAQGRSVSSVLSDYIYSVVGRPEDRRAATDPETDASAATDPEDAPGL